MKYLAHPEATLVTMWVIARHLSNADALTEKELVAMLRPPHLTSGEGLALKSSLSIGHDLGVFVRGEEATPRYDVGAVLKDGTEWFGQFDEFAHVVRRLLIGQAARLPDERSDVAIAVAWLLSRDWRRPNDPVSREDGAPEDAVATPEQLVTFGRWCRELGFGRAVRDGVMADPTAAIRRAVAARSSGNLPAREFVDLLSATVPTGPRHRLAGRASAKEDAPDRLELFTPVGFALKRLEREGLLRTSVRDDAKERLIFRFPGPTDPYVPVTHVEVVR